MKVVINTCYGGFGLSVNAILRYAEIKGIVLYPFTEDGPISLDQRFKPCDPLSCKSIFGPHFSTKPLTPEGKYEEDSYFSEYSIERDDPALVQTVLELGDGANGRCAKLKVVKIPDRTEYGISEHDGLETVEEIHRSWN